MSIRLVNLGNGLPVDINLVEQPLVASSTHATLRGNSYVADRLVVRAVQDGRLLVSADIMAPDKSVVAYGKLVNDGAGVAAEMNRIAAEFKLPSWTVDHCLMQLQSRNESGRPRWSGDRG